MVSAVLSRKLTESHFAASTVSACQAFATDRRLEWPLKEGAARHGEMRKRPNTTKGRTRYLQRAESGSWPRPSSACELGSSDSQTSCGIPPPTVSAASKCLPGPCCGRLATERPR